MGKTIIRMEEDLTDRIDLPTTMNTMEEDEDEEEVVDATKRTMMKTKIEMVVIKNYPIVDLLKRHLFLMTHFLWTTMMYRVTIHLVTMMEEEVAMVTEVVADVGVGVDVVTMTTTTMMMTTTMIAMATKKGNSQQLQL